MYCYLILPSFSYTENHHITINYTASLSAYNSLLRNLTYRNENSEPTSGMRIIEITVYDGNHFAQTMIIVVIISINDNRVMLEAGNLMVVLSEGATVLRVGQEAMLVLMDLDGEISSLQATLSNVLDQREEIRIANSSFISNNGTFIFINRTMSVGTYQVRNYCIYENNVYLYSLLQDILNNFVYSYPQAAEPLAGNRTITISASDGSSASTVSIILRVELINNNIPIVDLNGPDMDGLNYATSVNFNHVVPNRVAIATPFVSISDGDTDAFINKLEIRLNEESEDSLVLNLSNCNLPQGLAQISCQIM